jgi:aryl-alcohol dehydrogenase-like predicted oxidoreductase
MTAMDEVQVHLGASTVTVSPVGVGTNSWGAKGSADTGKRDTFAALLDSGITFFDTAEIYTGTASETTIGACIKAAGRTPTILTKCFPFPWRLSASRLRPALEKSLARLGLPRVDVYILHFPLGPVPLGAWMAALADVHHAGLARAVGISNCNAAQTRRAHAALAARGVPLACNEVELSLLSRRAATGGLLATCRELGVTVIGYRPLAQGMLSGKYSSSHPPTGIRRLLYRPARLARMEPLLAALRASAESHGRTPGQVAINWVLCKGAVPIPGAKDPAQARENAGAMGWRLTPEEISALEAAAGGT